MGTLRSVLRKLVWTFWASAIVGLASAAAAETCKDARESSAGCYCATVNQGYEQCDCGPYGFCEDCSVSGSCPAGGGGGGWDGGGFHIKGFHINWDNDDPCHGDWFCPAECASCR